MAVVVDTSEVAPEERFDRWAEVSAQVFEPIVLRAPRKRAFSARLARHVLGSVAIDHLSADASTATRTPDTIRLHDPDLVSVMLQLRGECFISQDNRDAVLRPGDLTCWQSSHPYTVGGERPFEVLMVRIPYALLGSHARRIDRRTAQRVDSDSGIAGVVGPYLSGLLAGLESDAFDAESHGHLSRSLLDLIPMLYSAAATPGHTSDLRERLHAYIDAHLFDPSLRPDRIAAAHFISRSYLNKLFAADGAGVHKTIRLRRLERCRHDLGDPALTHISTLSIAARWGFTTASHFSHAFRTEYGVSPREYRAGVCPGDERLPGDR